MEIDRRAYVERTDAIIAMTSQLNKLVIALHTNIEAINRSTRFK